VDDIAIGRLLRSVRVRLGLRQVDVGERAGVSQQLVSLLELGALQHVSVPALRRVARDVGAEVVIGVRWRGANVDRLRDEDHAHIVASLVRRLEAAGWSTATEVTYSVWGERGSIDVLAFHPATRTLLVIEVKTELVSAEETIRRLDQKVRLGPKIAAERLRWSPVATARLLAVMDTRTARRRVERHDSLFGRAFPVRGWAARAWLGSPAAAASLLLFVPYTSGTGARRGPATVRRVRRPRSRSTSGNSGRS
jgi:transcriptional regulator with XRE-family HTH domain